MADDSYPYQVKQSVMALIDSMKTLIARDPEQVIRGIALGVVDAAISAAKAAKPDDPVVASIADLFSPEQLGTGEPPRAADVLVCRSAARRCDRQPAAAAAGIDAAWQRPP